MAGRHPKPFMLDVKSLKQSITADALTFFKIGYFYEAFGEDATAAAPLIGASLARRSGVAMCGFPCDQVNTYLAKMVRNGRSVALAERNDEMKWYITRLITPGTAEQEVRNGQEETEKE